MGKANERGDIWVLTCEEIWEYGFTVEVICNSREELDAYMASEGLVETKPERGDERTTWTNPDETGRYYVERWIPAPELGGFKFAESLEA